MTDTKNDNRVDAMVQVLRNWQAIERQAINDSAEITEQTKSPLLRLVMEIIRHDSTMHHRVQQFLIDSVEKEAPTVTREQIAEIWDKLTAHDQAEKQAIQMAEELKKKAWSPVHKQLLDYLLRDEAKHDSLLEGLNEIKKGMSRASGG
jgi:rubrerythrin